MDKAPKGLRLHIGIFGRTNVGKSSLLNLIVGQGVAITSPVPGTTTDVVEKTMELLPIGPVVLLDTAGLDDSSVLAGLRIEKARKIFNRADVVLLVTEADGWTAYEDDVVAEAKARQIPVIIVINKIDQRAPTEKFLQTMGGHGHAVCVSCLSLAQRDEFVNQFKKELLQVVPEDFLRAPALLGDLLPVGGLAVFVVPIDLEAPKGRLILPQVQAIRDVLDHDAGVLVVKEHEYKAFLEKLTVPPDLVVCDSQVVLKVVAETPANVKCATFSILLARLKGDLDEMVRGALAIEALADGDRVLILEGCSHHPLQDDIGRVKIPRWLERYTGARLAVDVFAGHDLPTDLSVYKLIIHCGGCTMNRREMLFRIHEARRQGIPITNYGVGISYLQGVLERSLSPFPHSLALFQTLRKKKSEVV